MINTSIYKSEFQKMIRNNTNDSYVLQEGCDSANEAYLAPSLDREKFNQAMEKDCLFRKYATKFQVQRPDGTVVAVASSGTAGITATGQLYPVDADTFKKVTSKLLRLPRSANSLSNS